MSAMTRAKAARSAVRAPTTADCCEVGAGPTTAGEHARDKVMASPRLGVPTSPQMREAACAAVADDDPEAKRPSIWSRAEYRGSMGDPSERSAPVIVVAAADEVSGVVPPDRRFATACPPLKVRKGDSLLTQSARRVRCAFGQTEYATPLDGVR